MQAPLSGGVTFAEGTGRSGIAAFSAAQPAAPESFDWESLFVEDEALQVAAEVVAGRSDLRDLTALGMPRMHAAEVRRLHHCCLIHCFCSFLSATSQASITVRLWG